MVVWLPWQPKWYLNSPSFFSCITLILSIEVAGDIMSTVGDILSTVGVFSTVGDILSTVGDIMSTVGVFSTVGGYHDAREIILKLCQDIFGIRYFVEALPVITAIPKTWSYELEICRILKTSLNVLEI